MARDKSAAASAPAKPAKVKKTRWYHQVWQAYQMTRQQDPAVTWLILAVFFGIVAVGLVIGLVFFTWWYWLLLSIPFALLGAMFTLTRRAERAAYSRIEGQPGAAMSAVGTIRRGWTFTEEPVAIAPRTQDLVFRGVGRPGIVLIGEGPANRIGKLLESERKRTARVLQGVPITLIEVGREEGQVPLPQLARKVQRLKPQLTKQEVGEVVKRLQALGAVKMPVPKGIDPMRVRPDRKGMRGR
ncbi:DUF4191 domain-containing protein [Cellulomonas hominis]|jgi:hypothetical protein|uniref:Nitrate reductase NapE component n=1 Tax=Cellulomonas hominis TaxID=156981 RepID=A0A7W8SII4_9CELL|nr:DUF4191 domain-containing protein [Cellulomonas hominis]MBB5475469.1 nitrate reductase NapE component [Cellulomonas hominis]NKY07576.1 DUF4191 family protein [Cellulomonas hominis]NKY12121.1 DUF4191 family protein [Cellulomonas hominis]